MELVLVRHGLPSRDESSADPSLTEEGRGQARRAAKWLARQSIEAIYSSTMRRALETARPFADAARKAIVSDPGIVEFDRGAGAYIPLEQLKREDYPRWQAFVEIGAGADIVGFQATVVAALERIVARHPGQSVAVFCHGGVINVWTAYVLGMPPRLFFEPGYASIHRYLCARTGQRNLVSLNETAYLTDRSLAD